MQLEVSKVKVFCILQYSDIELKNTVLGFSQRYDLRMRDTGLESKGQEAITPILTPMIGSLLNNDN